MCAWLREDYTGSTPTVKKPETQQQTTPTQPRTAPTPRTNYPIVLTHQLEEQIAEAENPPVPVISTGGHVPIGFKEGVTPAPTNPNISPAYVQAVQEVQNAPPGTIISQAPQKPLTPGQQISKQFADVGRNLFYGKQTQPEQVWMSPDARYEYRPSSRQALAETITTATTSVTGGSIFRATYGNILMRRLMTGAMVGSTGYDIGQTAYDIKTGKLQGSMLGYKAFQTGTGLLGFVYGAGGKGFARSPEIITESKPIRLFKEPESIFDNQYIKNIVNYKTKPSVQLKLEELPGNKYLMTRNELIRLESPRTALQEIKTTSAETIGITKLNEIAPRTKTTQLSMYGSKVYEKPSTVTSPDSLVPWKFKSITEQSRLPETQTWTNLKFVDNKLVFEEIPIKKIKFSSDTTAESTLLLFRERPQRPTFESDLFKTSSDLLKPTFFSKMGFMYLPVENLNFRQPEYESPLIKQGSMTGLISEQIERQNRASDILRKTISREGEDRIQLPLILPGQQIRQDQKQELKQETDRVLERIWKDQDRTIKETIPKPELFRIPEVYGMTYQE